MPRSTLNPRLHIAHHDRTDVDHRCHALAGGPAAEPPENDHGPEEGDDLMIVDLESGMTRKHCRTMFDVVPLSTALQPGWPAGTTLVTAGALPCALVGLPPGG
ncbi:hypothetical protein [Kocuria turfanensis]|nr:hypothetical protein [Kocuria turfanensis]